MVVPSGAPGRGGAVAAKIRPLVDSDLDAADRVARLAFGTFLGLPDPQRFFGDAAWVHSRWRCAETAGIAAEFDGELIGSSFATGWGSIGVLGPLTVHPGYWGRSVGKALVAATMEVFARKRIEQVGLFTFADSSRHVGLYQRFGFWPRYLTAVMRTPVQPVARSDARTIVMSKLAPGERGTLVALARELTDRVHPGLDLTAEIEAVAAHSLGDTIMLDQCDPAALAVCHIGAHTEAGGGNCYVKFGAVRPGAGARERFVALIEACHELAASRRASTLVAGVNAGREQAWRALTAFGFTPQFQGVSMHRPNVPLYSTAGTYVIDDWR